MKKTAIIAGSMFTFLLAVFLFRPVPIVQEMEANVISGVVNGIYRGGIKDIVFTIEGDERHFYINRGEDLGLSINELREKLIGNNITIKYPEYWTPLDWNGSTRHLSKLVYQHQVIFNELKK